MEFNSHPDYVLAGFHMMKREGEHTGEEKAVIMMAVWGLWLPLKPILIIIFADFRPQSEADFQHGYDFCHLNFNRFFVIIFHRKE